MKNSNEYIILVHGKELGIIKGKTSSCEKGEKHTVDTPSDIGKDKNI